MMTKNADKKREQMMMFCMDDMVPRNHMLPLIDKAIDWSFIYDLVEEKYCPDNGRPSMDPVMLIKIPFIQYLYGIKSMRQGRYNSPVSPYEYAAVLPQKHIPFQAPSKISVNLERILFSRSLSVKSVFCENPKNSATTGFLINSNLSF